MSKKRKKNKELFLLFISYSKIENDPLFFENSELVYDEEYDKLVTIDGEQYFLYAFTDNIDAYNNFCRFRDMTKFHVVREKYTKKKYDHLFDYKHENYLKISSFDYHNTYLNIAVTMNEEDIYSLSVEWMDDYILELVQYEPCMNIIIRSGKKKLYENLKNIGVMNLLSHIQSMSIGEPVYVNPNIINLLLSNFGYTFI